MSDPPVLPSKKSVLFERSISLVFRPLGAALVVHHMAGDSATTDEPVHIAAGVEIVRDGTGRWNPEHPPLAKALAGLALTGLDVRPAGDPIANPSHAGLLLSFLFENRTPAETILFRARLPFVALFLALLLAVRREARRRFGTAAGGVALAFAALDPNLIAHAGVVHTDLAVTLFLVLSLGPLARIPDAADRLAPVALGVLWGLAFLSKYSAPLLVLVTLPLMFVGGPGTRENLLRKEREPSADSSQVAARFRWRRSRRRFNRPSRGSRGRAPPALYFHSNPRRALRILSRLSKPIAFGPRGARARTGSSRKGAPRRPPTSPSAAGRALPPLGNVATGALSVALQNRVGAGPSYFMGRVAEGGSPWYFPVAFLVKVSLGLLAGAALGAFSPGGHRFGLFVAGALAAFFVLSAGSAYNIGVRHLLFAFPLLAILAASATPAGIPPRGPRAAPRKSSFSCEAIEVLAVHPHELAFFNAAAGGSRGGRRFLVDSNLDWGQDLARLSAAAPAYSSEPASRDRLRRGSAAPLSRAPAARARRRRPARRRDRDRRDAAGPRARAPRLEGSHPRRGAPRGAQAGSRRPRNADRNDRRLDRHLAAETLAAAGASLPCQPRVRRRRLGSATEET